MIRIILSTELKTKYYLVLITYLNLLFTIFKNIHFFINIIIIIYNLNGWVYYEIFKTYYVVFMKGLVKKYSYKLKITNT